MKSFVSVRALLSMTRKMFSPVMNAHRSFHSTHSPDDEGDDVEVNNNRNSPNVSHRHGYSLENNESTDSSYKSYNNFNSQHRESNYHDNKNYDIHKKHR